MKPGEMLSAQGFLFLENEIPIETRELCTRYALLKQTAEFTPDPPDSQVPGAHSVYADTLMETLLESMQPRIEQLTGLDLFPTYSYYRVYRPGNELKRHRDRPSCEISVTICLGCRYLHDDPSYRWGIYFDATRGSGNTGTMLTMNAGDMAIYKGCDIEHWREPFVAQAGSYLVQAFLHYVDQHGPYREHRYDGRPGIGYPLAAGDSEAKRILGLISRAFPERIPDIYRST